MISLEQYNEAVETINQWNIEELERERAVQSMQLSLLEIETEIVKRVEYIMTYYDLSKKSRKRKYVTMRQALMFWLRENTNFSYRKVAKMIMKHVKTSESTIHSNCVHACIVCEAATKKIDPELWHAIETVKAEMAGLENKLNNK